MRAANAYERNDSQRSPSISSTLSPPGSPPPTYAAAVSVDSFAFDARPSPYSPPMNNASVIASPVTDRKDTLNGLHSEIRAYRSNFDDMTIPELAGDVVVFSATNTAGPVNPYELCASPGKMAYGNSSSSQRSRDSLSEMLGDLYFPVELASNDPGPPPGYPPQLRARSDQVRMSQTSYIQLRNRTMSEMPPAVHRRPLPTNTISDSLLTVHELPPLLAPHNTPLPVPSAVRSSNTRPLATGSSSEALYQSNNSQRPSSYAAQQSHWSTQAPANKHYSAPPPAPVSHTGYAAAFSADSTSSWGLDTQPKAPKTPRAQEPAVATRMQSQKRIMDLLGSIGT